MYPKTTDDRVGSPEKRTRAISSEPPLPGVLSHRSSGRAARAEVGGLAVGSQSSCHRQPKATVDINYI